MLNPHLQKGNIMLYTLTAGLLPAAVVFLFVYLMNRAEKQPLGLLFKVFIFGVICALPASLVALGFESIYTKYLEPDTAAFIIADNFLGAAIAEEFCKMEAAKLAVWKRPSFRYRYDAIVYCVTSSLGFAAIENILYVMDEDVTVAIMRGVISVPSHAVDGILMGIFFGLAKEAEYKGSSLGYYRNMVLCMLVPIMEHGIYDSLASSKNDTLLDVLFIYIVAVDIWAIRYIIRKSKTPVPIIPEEDEALPEEAEAQSPVVEDIVEENEELH